jgi:serine/threonine protein kinase
MAKVYGKRWKHVGRIGAGGQSEVFRVTDEREELDGEWALKRLRRKDRVERFRREVDILRRLDHVNIIKLVDAQVREADDDEDSFLVMPIAKYGDLDARLELYKDNIDSVVPVAKQVASALQHAHQAGIIHRDVKPRNILFPEIRHQAWVTDFGISYDQAAERYTADSEVVGPRFFIAPELDEAGPVQVSPAADVYSLGQVIFYMLTGGKRVAGQNVLDERYAEHFANGHRSHLLRLLLSKMIAPIQNRYADMERVMRELVQIENWEQTTS